METTKRNETQAWVRFILGIVAFSGVVWGASANVTAIANMAISNQTSIAVMVTDARRRDASIRSLELSDKERETNQIAILKALDRIEDRLGTK